MLSRSDADILRCTTLNFACFQLVSGASTIQLDSDACYWPDLLEPECEAAT